jgi:hypothetical protein
MTLASMIHTRMHASTMRQRGVFPKAIHRDQKLPTSIPIAS